MLCSFVPRYGEVAKENHDVNLPVRLNTQHKKCSIALHMLRRMSNDGKNTVLKMWHYELVVSPSCFWQYGLRIATIQHSRPAEDTSKGQFPKLNLSAANDFGGDISCSASRARALHSHLTSTFDSGWRSAYIPSLLTTSDILRVRHTPRLAT